MSSLSPSRPVTVVIPTLGKRRFLVEAVLCAASQKGVDTEVFVCADGPEAGASAKEILGSIGSRVRLIVLPEQRGAPACRNVGLRQATGDLILFLDDDDLVHPEMIVSIASAMEREGSTLGACSTVTVEQDARSLHGLVFDPSWGDPLERFLRHDVPWLPCSCLYHRDCPGLQEGWLEGLRKHQDWHMHTKCLLAGAQATVLSEPLAFWRQHGDARLSTTSALNDASTLLDALEDIKTRVRSQRHTLLLLQAALSLAAAIPASEATLHRRYTRFLQTLQARLQLPWPHRLRLSLFNLLAKWRPRSAWRAIHGTVLDPFSQYQDRRIPKHFAAVALRRLDETLANL